MNDLVNKKESITKKKLYQKGILEIEEKIMNTPGSFDDVNSEKLCPLKHTFADGLYIREIFMPKGLLITSKIHKYKHPYFIMSGKVSVLTDKGNVLLQAPFVGITERGTKRLLYIHEDTIWITVHVTQSKDLTVIEDEIIAKTFDDIVFDQEQIDTFYKEEIIQIKGD